MANKILTLVFSLFLLSICLRYIYRGLLGVEMFYTVMEAALVGGIADWFAITAIFRKPLGFPWHTALLPRHRDRVILAIGEMIEQDLLSVKSIKKRVDEACFVDLIIDGIDHKGGRQFLKSYLDKHSKDMLKKIDPLTLAAYLETYIRTKIREIKIMPQFKAFTKWGLEQKKDESLVVFILDELIKRIQKPDIKEDIYQYIEDVKQEKSKSLLEKTVIWLGEQTNSVNVSDATDALYQELLNILHEMKDPEHALHKWTHEKLIEVVNQPDNEMSWSREMELWKTAVVEEVGLTEIVRDLTDSLIDRISTSAHPYLLDLIHSHADQHWERFKSDQDMQQWLEVRIKQALNELVENEHHLIGTVVQEVLSGFTDKDLNQFIEDKAGDDLQWIRINGCVVGAFVGLIMFIFLHYFYDENVVPILQSWLYGR